MQLAVMIDDYCVHVALVKNERDTAVIRVVDLDGGAELVKTVDGLKSFMEKGKDIRIGWAKLPDFEVIYVYDRGDDNFGYAFNITDETLSEWGFAPFA
jgi:hypothetical protein